MIVFYKSYSLSPSFFIPSSISVVLLPFPSSFSLYSLSSFPLSLPPAPLSLVPCLLSLFYYTFSLVPAPMPLVACPSLLPKLLSLFTSPFFGGLSNQPPFIRKNHSNTIFVVLILKFIWFSYLPLLKKKIKFS